jgi:hypothetical protein
MKRESVIYRIFGKELRLSLKRETTLLGKLTTALKKALIAFSLFLS